MNRLLLLFLLAASSAFGQEFVYVNTTNLLLRDRPEKEYNVFDVLHAPCRLKVLPYSDSYKRNKTITGRFYYVVLSMQNEETKRSYNSYGWVQKQYVVNGRDKITARFTDSTQTVSFTITPLSDDPRNLNYRSYPYPKYKGGEKTFAAAFKRKYKKGPRGGCYYINAKGRKVYVDSKMCK